MDFSDAFLDRLDAPEASALDDGVGRNGVELFDSDGDGYSEIRVSHTDAGMTVARDRDMDGVIDTFTSVGRGGHYETWEIFRAANGSASWQETSDGEVFDGNG